MKTQTKVSNFTNLFEQIDINSYVLFYTKENVFYDETNEKTDVNILNDIEESLTAINKDYESHTISTINDGKTVKVVVFTE
tara:strand:- start:309 stop:551 length:243 start_codon:yes stop_codon:yes gene_type:complete